MCSVSCARVRCLSLRPQIARQLTLIESDYYKAIKPWECLGQAWTKSDKAVRAPNVLRFIHRFNQVSKWVAAEIVRVRAPLLYLCECGSVVNVCVYVCVC